MLKCEAAEIPAWAGLAFRSEDVAAAYRQIPNRPEEEAGLVIAWFDARDNAVRFAILHAHPYGLGTAVLNFNMVPALTSAVARRAFGAAVTHYFDDAGVLDLQSWAGSPPEAVICIRHRHKA